MFKKAETLKDIPNAFQPRPLDIDELEIYYVNVDNERDQHLSRMVELKSSLEKPNVKILFAGHRGSGKSTELNRLSKDIADKFFIVSFSVSDELDIGDVSYIDLVMVMMEKLADKAERANLISEDHKYLEMITNWLTEVTKIRSERTGYHAEVEAGLKASRGMLGHVLGIIAEFKASVKAGSEQKKEYREKIEPSISLLKTNCNILINEIEKALMDKGKRLLIIIEDLDKVEPLRIQEIFGKRSGILAEINTKIIYTVSIFSLSTPNLRDMMGRFHIQSLPMIKVNEKGGLKEHDSGIDAIRRIVNKRVAADLFEEKILTALIVNSGGVLRDLFEMIEVAANSADYRGSTKIKSTHIKYSLERLKAKYLDMITVVDEKESAFTTEALYDKLVKIAKSPVKKFPMDEMMLLLLSCLAVVEYNGEQWFDVHPAVRSLLKDMGKLA